jgi:hypothetical protein
MASFQPGLSDVIDASRHPITQLNSAEGRRLLERCREELAASGACQLECLMHATAVRSALEDARKLSDRAYRTEAWHNVYFEELIPDAGDADPKATRIRSAKRALGWKYLGASSPLRILYESDALLFFLREVLQVPELYRDADPLGACSVMFYDAGDELGWHFDNSDFAVTLMLQDSQAGGQFEYVPNTRSPEDEHIGTLKSVLAGDRSRICSLDSPPGTLTLFCGRHSLHRVTPVSGSTQRVNAVFAYAGTPDHRLTPLTRALFYGSES